MGEIFVPVCVIGPGLVGSELIRQLNEHGGSHGIRVVAVANSRKMNVAKVSSVADPAASAALGEDSDAVDFAALSAHLLDCAKGAGRPACPVIADCTSSDAVASQYAKWLSEGISVCTPNKKAFSGARDTFDACERGGPDGSALCMHEATVGAGLPVLTTIRDLVATGDRITRIDGVLSGTISYLFNAYSRPGAAPAEPFSQLVAGAKEKGFTEPDPRDDLDGSDFARKVVILARVAGAVGDNISLDGVRVGSLVPAELRDKGSVDAGTFMERLPEFDGDVAALEEKARADGKVIRMVGSVVFDAEGKGAQLSVEMGPFDATHPFAGLSGSDNIVAISSDRYKAAPLVIRGAGAGAAVTAHGIFRDILEAARRVRVNK